MKSFSLATELDPTQYQAFEAAVAANAPHTVKRVQNAKLSVTFASATGWSLLTCWGIALAVFAVIAIMGLVSR